MNRAAADAARALSQNRLGEAESLSLAALAADPADADSQLILGIVYSRTRRNEEAKNSFERVLKRNPDSREANIGLAETLRKMQRFDEALAYAEALVARHPDAPHAFVTAGMCLIGLARFQEAESYLRSALDRDRRPSTLHSLGIALSRQRKDTEALAVLEEASRAEPFRPNHLVLIGQTHLLAYRFEPAIRYAEMARALDPSDVGANLLLAEALRLSGRPNDAGPYLQNALVGNPNSPEANAQYGVWLQQMGQLSESEQYIDRALELDPRQPLPLFAKTQLRKISSHDKRLLETMQEQASSPSASAHDRMILHFGLGKAFDDLGDMEAAFSHFDLAHQFARQAYRAEGPDRVEDIAKYVDKNISVFTRENLDRWKVFGNDSERPIFIVGMIRSGTTLMEQLLSNHPQVVGAGELYFWTEEAVAELDESTDELDPARTAEVTNRYLRLLEDHSKESRFVTDKLPTNFLRLGFIHASLPRAKMIDMVRDPLDVSLSIWTTYIPNPPHYCNERKAIVEVCVQHQRLRTHWAKVLPPDRYLQVRYEELTQSPEATMRKVLEFCGLDWDERCLHPETNERFVVTPSLYRVRRAIDSTSVQKKDRYGPYLGEFSSLAE